MRVAIRKAALLAALATTAFAAQAAQDAARRTPTLPSESCLEPVDAARQAAEQAAPPPLLDGLGNAGIEPDSDHPEARAYFAQGVRLIWAFDEVEAIRAFRAAQRLDPSCAMCFFGEAWARGPTINLNPRDEELAAARAAIGRAQALSDGLGARDRLLIEGQALRTRDGDAFDGEGYAAFMERAALRMPADDTIQIMAADARMIINRGEMPPGNLSQRLLERVLARNPDHVGAIHFYIHITDWMDRQHLAVPYAERLGRLAPAASPLVHMPSHSFYGVGRYADAAAANVAAIAADRAFNRTARPEQSDYRFYLNRHNMHFAINSALARGDGATAAEVSAQYRDTYLTGTVAPPSRLLGSAVFYTAGLHAPPAEVLALPEAEHAIDRAMRHYARGEAQARAGDAAAVRAEAAAIAARLAPSQLATDALQHLLYGLSLGSVLLLASLGLAVTFGLMRVINMAHGEMVMLGAYSAYAVQVAFAQHWPGAQDAYLLVALPVAFGVTAGLGMALERTVIRRLYGRPLETLLTTWGISLILIQTVRLVFGAQNVAVANPSWLTGSVEVLSGVDFPYARIATVLFAGAVLLFIWFLLQRTRLGLEVRAVTQNRAMAAAMGIATERVDLLTFGLGSGIAGLGGVALSQMFNVGPELGQGYIVDCFMVVVLGGVGKLAGAVAGALGLGIVNKLLEPLSGAVLGKIAVLLLVILSIQWRPEGIFALRGRAAES